MAKLIAISFAIFLSQHFTIDLGSYHYWDRAKPSKEVDRFYDAII